MMHRNRWNPFLFSAAGILLSGALCAQDLILPSQPSPEEETAATELKTHLSKALGKEIRILTESDSLRAAAPRIHVGKTRFALNHKIDGGKMSPESWRLKSVGKEDLIVCGGAPRGTLYAAFELLEREFGVMWLDEETVHIPKRASAPCLTHLDLSGKPAFPIRGLYAYFKNPQDARRIFMMRNRQNLFHDEGRPDFLRKWGLTPVFGSPRACHTYYDYTKDWGPEQENCFSLGANGKRIRSTSASGPGQICFTNPETVRLFSLKLREFIRRDLEKFGELPMVYEVSANDNDAKCVCKQCRKAAEKYSSYAGVVLEFTNALAATVEKDYPNLKLEMFAYMFAEQPPKNITAHRNVLIRIAQLGSEFANLGKRDSLRPLSHPNNAESMRQIREWGKIGDIAIWDYWIMYMKKPTVSTIGTTAAENLRFYSDRKVKSIFVEVESPMETIFYGARLWLGYRLMNNPHLNYETERKKFMSVYYGNAADVMNELMTYIEKRNGSIPELLTNLSLRRRLDLDDAFFRETERLLDRAEKTAKTPEERKRIAKERLVIDLVRLERRHELAPFDQEKVMKRMTDSLRLCGKMYLDAGGLDKYEEKLETFFCGLKTKIPAPEQFKGFDIAADLTWPFLNDHYKSRIMDVKDASGGRAVVMKGGPKESGNVQFGFYEQTSKRQAPTLTVKKEKIPSDEKFHYYRVGKITLPPKSYVWAHPSWTIQRSMNEFYESNGMPNDYELFLSIKLEGPAYVKGSNKENSFSLDRILLIRPDARLAELPAGEPLFLGK